MTKQTHQQWLDGENKPEVSGSKTAGCSTAEELHKNAKAAYVRLTNRADLIDDTGQILHIADKHIMAAFDEYFG